MSKRLALSIIGGILLIVLAALAGWFWCGRNASNIGQQKNGGWNAEPEVLNENQETRESLVQSPEVKASVARILRDIPKDSPVWQIASLVTATSETNPFPMPDTSSWKTYRDPDGRFELKIPNGWDVEYPINDHESSSTCFFDPKKKMQSGMMNEDGTFNDENYLDYRICISFYSRVAGMFNPDMQKLLQEASHREASTMNLFHLWTGELAIYYPYSDGYHVDIFGKDNNSVRFSVIYHPENVLYGMVGEFRFEK